MFCPDPLLYLQLVTLPYNLLLQKSAREALGFSLKDHIVVIDEAHSMSGEATVRDRPALIFFSRSDRHDPRYPFGRLARGPLANSSNTNRYVL